jgi:chorismate lyase/3-hydroxybenzoate synthase
VRARHLTQRFLAPDELTLPGEFPLARICYGPRGLLSADGLVIDSPLESLGAPSVELWSSVERPRVRRDGELLLAETEELCFGALTVEEHALEADVGRIYDQLLEAVAGSPTPHLLRLWNVVPHVGRAGGEALDRYMVFCRARSHAFERHFGRRFDLRLGAASAVGSFAGPLLVYFLAGRTPGGRISNPRQEEPWLYPRQYGPRAPSFARALVGRAPLDDTLFVSGTASIVGHLSKHAGDLRAQVDETLRNLAVLARSVGGVPFGGGWELRVYLREGGDLELVRSRLRERFGEDTPILFLHADVCRPELAVEIEALVRRP